MPIFIDHANKTIDSIYVPTGFPNLYNTLSQNIKPTPLINLLYLYVDLNK